MIAYDRLSAIIPPGQALANKALQVALQQVSGIALLTLPQFTQVVKNVETTKDLPLINALNQAVPSSTANFYINSFGTGSGVNNTIEIVDVLGTASGWISTDALGNTVTEFATMNLNYLTTIYQTMLDVVDGVYTDMTGNVIIPPGTPGTGTYSSEDDAVSSGLIPIAQTEVGNIVVAYPNQVAVLNTDWNNMANQLVTESSLQSDADLVFANLIPNSKTSVFGFINSLPSYGTQTEVGGMAQFIENCSDLAVISGQAIVGCLRQGRDQVVLDEAGVSNGITIPNESDTPPPQAQLIPSKYT